MVSFAPSGVRVTRACCSHKCDNVLDCRRKRQTVAGKALKELRCEWCVWRTLACEREREKRIQKLKSPR